MKVASFCLMPEGAREAAVFCKVAAVTTEVKAETAVSFRTVAVN